MIIDKQNRRSAGDYSDEDAYNCETDNYDLRKIKIICPHCGRKFAALCSKLTKLIHSGMRWVGCDHKEPYGCYETKCTKCKNDMHFTVHTPQ